MWMNGHKEGKRDAWLCGWVDGWMDDRMGRWIVEWMDELKYEMVPQIKVYWLE